jgi:hypothetical protein
METSNNFQQRGEGAMNQSRERQANEEKFCPFLSGANGHALCTPKCKLHRKDLKDFECTFQELRCIAWNTSKKNQSTR